MTNPPATNFGRFIYKENHPDKLFPKLTFKSNKIEREFENTFISKGLEWSSIEDNSWRILKILDQESEVLFLWMIFEHGLPQKQIMIETLLPPTWEGSYHWNHVLVRKDHTRPYFSKKIQVSRNTWSNTIIDTSLKKACFELMQIKTGPVHVLWIIKPGTVFPVKSFKDVGLNETGGVKFRIENSTYILFAIQTNGQPEDLSINAKEDLKYTITKYHHEELDTIWGIYPKGIRRWR